MHRRSWVGFLLLLGVFLAVLSITDREASQAPGAGSTSQVPSETGRPTASPSDSVRADQGLPREALETIDLIEAGGPFPYDRDGSVFMNRERLLPQHPRGYWREYTVPTPGASDRGARRLVAGQGGELYYTGDHYRSFTRVEVASG
ncbi:hypothetical protein C6I20_05610 [Aeromicrobium sp. A1-2]|uniref:ribonuclease domain-containing protein n=1 Tax=Aeromicrobium sp. A1-2 TaxID=2107713 RepID=UPI000E48E80D|nr:ribonuclease domain-containing protein [Aeromicrobium sp. A1-2]AXT86768.1 hypothetical protein C6I20_05610 [Aeromicrobium sp. A1-2]